MNRPHGQQWVRGGAIGRGITLALVLGFLTKVQAQEIWRLPPVEGPADTQNDIRELRQQVQELENTVAAIQEGTVSCLDHPVHAAVYSQQDAPYSQPVKPASLSESIFAADYNIDIGGYVKADFIHDFNAIGSTDAFDPLSIPTDGRRGENTRLHARQTRLNLDFHPPRLTSECKTRFFCCLKAKEAPHSWRQSPPLVQSSRGLP